MEAIIELLYQEIDKVETENGNDDYHDGIIDGLIIAIKAIKEMTEE